MINAPDSASSPGASSPILRVEPQGVLLRECSLPGEGRADGATPAHPNGVQLSRDRFLLLYSTRGFRGRDDEWSAIYQLRKGGWNGSVLKEGYLSRTSNDWDPLGDGHKHVLQNGHPVAFGVPKGALIGNKRVSHENRFVAMWRIVARALDPETGHVLWEDQANELFNATCNAIWAQFRLNDAEDDIEITVPARPLRQKGFEEGAQICSDATVSRMIKGFVCPVPFSDDCTEWVDINTINGETEQAFTFLRKEGRVLPVKYRWNPDLLAYEWAETGVPLGPDLFEGSIARYHDGFVIAARMVAGAGDSKEFREGKRTKVVAWCHTCDPFSGEPKIVKSPDHPNWHPVTTFAMADGSVCRIGGCVEHSPYKVGRDPIYLVRVDPENGFSALDHWPIYSARTDPSLDFSGPPYVDFGKLLPHTGGREQVIVHRVRSSSVFWGPERPGVRSMPGDIEGSAIHWAKVIYKEEQPPTWQF